MHYSVRNAADLGAAVQSRRLEAGLTQTDLASRAGVSRSYLSHLESGRSSRLLNLLLDLLRLLDLELVVRRRGSHDG